MRTRVDDYYYVSKEWKLMCKVRAANPDRFREREIYLILELSISIERLKINFFNNLQNTLNIFISIIRFDKINI